MIPARVLVTVMRHDWRVMDRSRSWQSIVALFLIFSALGIHNGLVWARAQRESFLMKSQEQVQLVSTYKSEQARYEQAVSKGLAANPPSASMLLTLGIKGKEAILPLSPLAALSLGQAGIYPVSATVNMYNHRSDLFAAGDRQSALSLLSGRLDLAFVIVYIYPLLIIAASYNLISSEREGGMLAATLVQPVRLHWLVAAKTALRATFLCSLAGLCTLLAIVWSGADLASADVRLRVLLWLAAILLYGVWWLLVCLAVNLLGRGSAANAMVLAGSWVMFMLIIPGMLGIVVSGVYPTPSRLEITQAGRRAGVRAEAAGKAFIEHYYAQHPELASGASSRTYTDDARMYYAVHAEVERAIAPMIARHDDRLANQHRLIGWCRFLSPAIVTLESMNDLAGTGMSRFGLFRAQAAAFQTEWQSFFVSKIFLGARMTLADYETHPQFVFHDEDLDTTANRVLVGFAGLSVATLLIGTVVACALRRYPILPS